VATLPTPRDRDYCATGHVRAAQSARETALAACAATSTIFATYNNAGVRVVRHSDAFAPREIASGSTDAEGLIDPRPNVALAAKSADVYVSMDG
jgi:hypothetical protein